MIAVRSLTLALASLVGICLVALGAAPAAIATEKPSPVLTVFAAASLTDALQAIVARRPATAPAVRLSFAASSALAKQIEAGARADIFVSADTAWMDYVEARGHALAATRRPLVGNRLVLVVPKSSPIDVDVAAGPAWLELLPRGRIAIGDPAHVPAGRYARQALTRLGGWPAVERRLALADNVRGALVLVERGEAAAGIVYASDAAASKGVRIAATFPESSHDAIVYPVALLKSESEAAARAFCDLLFSPEARAIFAQYGFTAPR